jgi:hypothetical protein
VNQALRELFVKLKFPGDDRRHHVGSDWKPLGLSACENGVDSCGTWETLRCNLLAIDRHVAGGFDSDSDLIAIDFNHRDKNVVTDDDLLA